MPSTAPWKMYPLQYAGCVILRNSGQKQFYNNNLLFKYTQHLITTVAAADIVYNKLVY